MQNILVLSVAFALATADSGHFDYRDPDNWGAEFPQCGGAKQSPIDIDFTRTTRKKYSNPLRSTNINVKPIEVEIVRSPQSATFNFYWACCAPHIYAGPLNGIYQFDSMHCHWGSDDEGSEHTINGKHFALECHLVFFNVRYPSKEVAVGQSNGLAVFALLYNVKPILLPNLAIL